jgi:hypothetical protein
MALTHVDDTILCGEKKWIEWFKKGIHTRFNYTDMGQLKKHLGIWYEWVVDENGKMIIIATMPKMVNKIIDAYKNHTGSDVKKYITPGAPSEDVEPTNIDKYRSIVDKIMYFLATKIMGEGSNQVHE